MDTRHTQPARLLADKLRALDADAQLAAVAKWRTAVAEIVDATKKARRSYQERHRLAKLKGRSPQHQLPGLRGVLHDGFWDFVVEGACAGAGRELASADAPVLVDVYRQVEAKGLEAARTSRGARLRQMLDLVQRSAVAVAYVTMRGASFFDEIGTSLVLPEAVGKEKPEVTVAVLALLELGGHAHAEIARELNIDSSRVRDVARSRTQQTPSSHGADAEKA